MEPTLKQLETDYAGKIRFVWKNKILPFHAKAPLAHNAALAAGEQGKFWEMHDKIFAGQPNLERDTFLKYATELGLNVDKFTKAMDDPNRYKDIVGDEARQAEALGIGGTPTFVINGHKLVGAQPVETFKKAVEDALAKKG